MKKYFGATAGHPFPGIAEMTGSCGSILALAINHEHWMQKHVTLFCAISKLHSTLTRCELGVLSVVLDCFDGDVAAVYLSYISYAFKMALIPRAGTGKLLSWA